MILGGVIRNPDGYYLLEMELLSGLTIALHGKEVSMLFNTNFIKISMWVDAQLLRGKEKAIT
jgi:hypothetical protein